MSPSSRREARDGGFTLIEVTIAMGILVIVLVLFGRLAFGVPLRGSPWTLALLGLLGLALAAMSEAGQFNWQQFKGTQLRVLLNKHPWQASIEPHVVVTWWDEDDRLVIRTSTQVPFHARRILAPVLQLPIKRIRVIKPRIGGGFGGKQEVLIEDVAAHLTIATGRPVLFELLYRLLGLGRVPLQVGNGRSGRALEDDRPDRRLAAVVEGG